MAAPHVIGGTDGTATREGGGVMSDAYQSSPLLDNDDRFNVWWRVIDAIEDALEVEGMPARDREALAWLQGDASTWVGVRRLTLPDDMLLRPGQTAQNLADHRAWCERLDRANGAGGVRHLDLAEPVWYALVRAGVCTLTELRDAVETTR